MIKIEKGWGPDYLHSREVALAIEKMEKFYSSMNRDQQRHDFPLKKEIDRKLKEILHERFHGKCGYCEIKISEPQAGVVDRFRPHNGVRDEKEYYKDLYWWLTYEWDNLIYSCKECHQYKANYFPVKGVRASFKGDFLTQEEKLLLNPCTDNPNDHFFLSNLGTIAGGTEEAHHTIELLRLNRSRLNEKRLSAIERIKSIIADITEDEVYVLNEETLKYLQDIFNQNPKIEFLFAKSYYLNTQIEHHPDLFNFLKRDSYSKLPEFEKYKSSLRLKKLIKYEVARKITNKNTYFPIEYIEIKNFKSITNLKIDFPEKKEYEPWIFLLGENGVGKSSILQAIAIGLYSNLNNGDDLISELIQRRKHTATITIKERSTDNIIKTVLNRKEKTIKQSGHFKSNLIGYSSSRLMKQGNLVPEKTKNGVRYMNLFDPTICLNDVTKWLVSVHRKDLNKFNSIAYSVRKLLPDNLEEQELTIKGGKLVLSNSPEVSISSFSEGYKSVITLALDIMKTLSEGITADMDKLSGVVLIDEIGNQLHPRWQMQIVRKLREIFPRIQFIVSSHHPLCLRGVEKGEVILLKEIEGKLNIITELPDPSEFRVDQLLTSEFFGLSSLIDPDLENKFHRYYQLLSFESDLKGEHKGEYNRLKEELKEKKHFGNSLRDELMYETIDKLLAQKVLFSENPLDRMELKGEVVSEVKKIWDELKIEGHD
ncbi:AAA family ATPase [Marinifilum fragile]|uniref:AAA family ATPase n=1 Tax=Marinifilum fragile TaxID=570161 RepID=UPI002AA887EC|nr:AAA family ATPase [Marinifilum fragile]